MRGGNEGGRHRSSQTVGGVYGARPSGYDPAIQGTLRRIVLAAALLAALPAAALAVPAAAYAAGVDETCQLTATRFDADTVNVLYPDSSAQYWSASYTAVPGTRIRIDGVFPYARYTS